MPLNIEDWDINQNTKQKTVQHSMISELLSVLLVSLRSATVHS